MSEITRRRFLKRGLAVAVAPLFLGNKNDDKVANAERPEKPKPNTEVKDNEVKRESFEYNCLMACVRYNHERGFLSDKRYTEIKNNKIVRVREGEVVYYNVA